MADVPVIKLTTVESREPKALSMGYECPYLVYYAAERSGKLTHVAACSSLDGARDQAMGAINRGRAGVHILDLSGLPPIEY